MSLIVIDPGHGGADPGGRSLGTAEKDLVLPYARELGIAMKRRGHRVILTREMDASLSLGARARLANDAGADLFVSVHANASDKTTARGPWTIYARPSARGKRIAEAVQKALAGVLNGSVGAAYPDESPWVGNRRLAVLRQTRAPAVLLELGFMTNAQDLVRMEDPVVRKCVVEAVAAALDGELDT